MNRRILAKQTDGLYWTAIREAEIEVVRHAMTWCLGNQVRAAKMLGINRNTLRARLKYLDSISNPNSTTNQPIENGMRGIDE